eukprot:scaffold35060_cov272-Skeletonema_dohrnii-CCMP3373.AAC.1
MYYSIPGVRQASLRHNDVDYSDIASLSRSVSLSSSPSWSRPSQAQEEGEDDARKVSRRTCISFECHPDVLMEDLMDEMDQELGDLSLDFDDFVSMLRRSTTPRSTMQSGQWQ